MAVKETITGVKVMLDLTKGSQTIPNCKQDASAEALYTLGNAVGDLHEESVQKIYKITEAELA